VWRILGLRVEVRGKCPPGGRFLVVSNHLGYLDIAVLSGVLPVTFVSKSEVRSWPFIGFLARSAGTIFVAREDRRQAKDFIDQVGGRLAAGENVHVFPEGTSSRGETILPFKTAVFASVTAVPGSRVLPVRIDLLMVGGKTANGGIRDIACWHGDMEFAPHFWNFLGSGGARFRVQIGTPVWRESLDRKTLSRIARDKIIDLGKETARCRTLLPGGWIWVHPVP
jgi:1-acyl-sn-glycerol-3-phosphate acyltransferase